MDDKTAIHPAHTLQINPNVAKASSPYGNIAPDIMK
jgi:hypothetical protein